MKRRTFIQATAAALASHGCLPLLATQKETSAKKVSGKPANSYVEPSAIEPITGVLPTFSPVAGAAMSGAFAAQYSLLAWEMAIVKPHLAFVCPQRFFDLYPKDVKPPRINPNDHDDIPAVGRAFAKISDDRKFKRDKAWTRVRRAYLACISWADYNVGRVLEALEASPYADNTIVVLWSDHGYGQGEKRHFRKFALWEETTKVPFIIWDAREKSGCGAGSEGRRFTDQHLPHAGGNVGA